MEKSSGNEKTIIHNEDYEIFMNELECENEVMKKTYEGPSLQTKEIRIKKNDEEKVKKFL